MSRVTILGGGAWGTALAIVLARGGRRVRLCVHSSIHLAGMREKRINEAYLPGVAIPPEIELAPLESGAIASAEVVVLAIPSRFARAAITPLAASIGSGAIVASVTKGIEERSLLTMSQMIDELAPQAVGVAALSGPGFATEVARGQPAALVAAARDPAIASRVQTLFAVHPLRVYRSNDLIGVEIGGAAKNVIAIAAGISDGLELGSSARAALITRGLAEIMRLATAAGGVAETLAGLAGLGDLVLTCTGDLSRNRSVGRRIASGGYQVGSAGKGPVAEGVANAGSIRALASRLNVEMPIVQAVYEILYEGAPAGVMVEKLLSRELKAEF